MILQGELQQGTAAEGWCPHLESGLSDFERDTVIELLLIEMALGGENLFICKGKDRKFITEQIASIN